MDRRAGFRWTPFTTAWLALALLALFLTAGLSSANAWAGSVGDGNSAADTGRTALGATPTPTCRPQYTLTTATGAIVPGTEDIGNQCDDCNTKVGLPFPYRFYGQTYNSVGVSSNGILQFTSDAAGISSECLPSTRYQIRNFIAAYWDDLCTGDCFFNPCEGCGVFTSVSGSSPDRIFNVEWRACVYDLSSAACHPVNFEARLYEAQDRLDLVYGNVTGYTTDATAGVQGSAISAYTQYTCNGTGFTPGLQLVFTPASCTTPTGTPPTQTPTSTLTPTSTRTPTHTPIPVTTCGPNSNYTVTASTGAIVAGTTDTGNHCDDCTTAITLPFTYRLYGQSFSTANVGSNGTVQFASNYPLGAGFCLPHQFFDFSYAIFPYMVDLVTDRHEGQGIFTSVSGTAPNRIFNIEWRTSLYSVDEPANFELRLYEGQDRFDVVYGQMPDDYDYYYFTVGAQRDNFAYTQYQCHGAGPNPGLLLTFTQPACGTGKQPQAP